MTNGRFKAILFDKDGTLFDVNGTWVPYFRDMLQAEMKITVAEAEALMAQVGYIKSTDRIAAGSVMAGGTTRQMVDLWWPELDMTGRDQKAAYIDLTYADLSLTHLKPLLPLEPVLDQLHALGFTMGLATNDSKVATQRHIDSKNLRRYLKAVITSDIVPRPKPSGDMVRAFAAHAGIVPHEIVMVGDNLHDIEEARQGGAGLAVGVLTGNGSSEDLEKIADYVIPSIAELPQLLAQAS
jgi:phosphoglycolate phosphatase